MKVPVGVSNRHIHLTEEDLHTLCGDEPMTAIKDLKQPGQYASTLLLTIKTEKSEISNVRVLGPTRPYTQVELSKTDAYKLGIDPPVRESGDLTGASPITITGPVGSVTKKCAIIANRHIHISPEDRKAYNLENVSSVSVKIGGEKGGTLDNVSLKETTPAYFEIHLDTDDANAHLLKNNDELDIILNN